MRAERGLALGVVALATLAVLPLAAIVIRGFAPGAGATWSHLASTVLGTYAGNTLALVVMVGLGVAFGGTAAGWLVARRTFPGTEGTRCGPDSIDWRRAPSSRSVSPMPFREISTIE